MASIYLETRPAVGHGIVALNLRVIHRKVGMSSCAQFNARALQANRLLVGLALWTLIVHGLELRASPLADPCLSISTSLYPRQTIPVTSAISTAPPSGLSSIPAPSPSSVSVSEPNPTQSFPPSANSSLPSLDGFIEQSTPNSNNVTITLQNNGLQDLLVYTPFSFLSPGLESQTLHLYAANGTQVGSPPPANIDFGVPTDPSNFTTIAVGRSLEANLDLTEIFNISRSGNYTLEVQPAFIGGVRSNEVNVSVLYDSAVLILAANTSIHLPASSPGASLPPRSEQEAGALQEPGDNVINCSPEDKLTVTNAVMGATQLARWALNPDTDIQRGQDWDLDGYKTKYWGSYRNDPLIAQVYGAIGAYNISDPNAAPGITWVCDRAGTYGQGFCNSVGPLAYANNAVPRIVFCSGFFSQPAIASWIPSWLLWAEGSSDQEDTALHEMTHIQALAGGEAIIDVPDEDWFSKWYLGLGFLQKACYSYSCTVGLGQNPWGDYTPLQNAQNWAYYAKTVGNCRFQGGCRR